MYDISNTKLDEVLLYSSDKFNTQYPEYYQFLKFLYDTGLRIADLFNIENYSIVDSNYFSILQSKNKTLRIINNNIMPIYVSEYLFNNNNTISNYSIHCLNNFLIQLNSTNCLFADNRLIPSYCFRYNVFKKKFAELNNIKDVSNFMGEINDFNTISYIYKPIKTLNKNIVQENIFKSL